MTIQTRSRAIAMIAIVLSASAVRAADDCTTGINFGGNSISKLTVDYVSHGGTTACLNVSGAGVDLDSHVITCDTGPCYAAIQLNDFTGSTTTATAKNAFITGDFETGILSFASAKTTVISNNDIETAYNAAAINAGGRISGNKIYGSGSGIVFFPDNHVGSAYQYVQDNFIDSDGSGAGGIIIGSNFTGTGTGPKIQNNFVRAPFFAFGDYSTFSGKANVLGNIFVSALNGTTEVRYGSGSGIAVGSNVCDIDLTTNDTTSSCTGTSVPFALP